MRTNMMGMESSIRKRGICFLGKITKTNSTTNCIEPPKAQTIYFNLIIYRLIYLIFNIFEFWIFFDTSAAKNFFLIFNDFLDKYLQKKPRLIVFYSLNKFLQSKLYTNHNFLVDKNLKLHSFQYSLAFLPFKYSTTNFLLCFLASPRGVSLLSFTYINKLLTALTSAPYSTKSLTNYKFPA